MSGREIKNNQDLLGALIDEGYRSTLKKMNQVPNILGNPAVVGELELDGDEVDPADVTPFMSGNAPIITVPASADEEADVEVVAGGAEGGREEMEDMYNFLGEIVEKIQAFTEINTFPSQNTEVLLGSNISIHSYIHLKEYRIKIVSPPPPHSIINFKRKCIRKTQKTPR